MASSQATGDHTPVVEAKEEPMDDIGMDGTDTGGGQNGTTPAEDGKSPSSGGQNGTPPVEDGRNPSSGEKQPPPSQPPTGETPAEQNPPSGGGKGEGGNDAPKPNGENQSPPLSAEGIDLARPDFKEGFRGNKRLRPDSAQIDNSNQRMPLFKAEKGGFDYSAPSHGYDDSDFDDDLHGDLIGRQQPPKNMETLELVKDGKTPMYLNEYSHGKACILRIQPMKDHGFNKQGREPLTSNLPQTGGYQKCWGDVYDVLGVAIPGDENNPLETLAKIDPENSDAFQWGMSLFIRIRWKDGSTSYVNRQWWRKNYVAKHTPPAEKRKTYSIRSGDGYRENVNGFKDYRLLKWAMKHEKKYWEATNPGQAFHSGRDKSPSPIDDDIARLREATMPPETAPPNPNIGVRNTIEPELSQNTALQLSPETIKLLKQILVQLVAQTPSDQEQPRSHNSQQLQARNSVMVR
ncbi:hypothetical protein LRP88_14373 [Fusarium phalaenopsidis]|nr:hypothetical protein NCS56_01544500 [Fusarium sp. Ph1]